MLKKLLFAGILTTGLATLALVAQPVSADYYDCNGNIRSGDPRPSECHYYLVPSQTTTTTDSSRNRADIITDTSSTSSSSYDSDRTRADVVTEIGSSSTSSVYETDRNRADIITEIGRDYYDYERPSTDSNAILADDPDDYSKEYEVRNARKYCMRDYCYIIYDYCYDLTHCEEKVYKMPREQYQYGDNWRDMLEDYLNDYFGRNRYDDCDRYYRGRCIYRGFYFGGFHNGYWYY